MQYNQLILKYVFYDRKAVCFMKEMDLMTVLRGIKKVLTVQTIAFFVIVATILFNLFYPEFDKLYWIILIASLAGLGGSKLLQKEEMEYMMSSLKQQPDFLKSWLTLEYGGALLAMAFVMAGMMSVTTSLLGDLSPASAAFFGLVSLSVIAWRNNKMFMLARIVLEGKESVKNG